MKLNLTAQSLISAAIFTTSMASTITSAAAATPAGQWMWDDGAAAVEFHPCGESLCGRIIWVKPSEPANAAKLLDVNNPDPALRSRPICGLDYITDLKRSRGGDWEKGRIYDFNGGGTYDLDITRIETSKITMRGYKGIPLLGSTMRLIPAPADLHSCVVLQPR